MFNEKYSIRRRMFIYILVAVLLLFLSMGSITYALVFKLIIAQNEANGKSVARAAAEEINGDDFESIDSKDCKAFKEVHEELSEYYVFETVHYIYTMVYDGQKLRFVVDSDPEDPADYLEEYPMFDDILPAFNGQVCSDQEIQHDEWGSFLSSYAPIFNSKGEVVGVVGVDTKIEYLNNYGQTLAQILLVIVVLFAGVIYLIYITISNDYMGKDVLTELYNQERLELICQKRYVKNNSLHEYTAVLLNIRGFSLINSKYSYLLGDKVLKFVAEQLRQETKNNGLASRVSSDNFIVIIRNGLVDDFLNHITNVTYHSDRDKEVSIPLQICCGVYPIHEGDEVSEVIARGLVALRIAKRIDTDDVMYYSGQMYETAIYEKQILADFDSAIENNEFVVYYQPKVDITKAKLYGAEALVRWKRDGKMIPPGMFIPIYEKEGKITDLDFYVFEKVCKALRYWKDAGMELVPISSNFSKMHLLHEDFADKIIALADKYQVEHKYIDIELTESSGYSDREVLEAFIHKLRTAGIHTSMDDFGSGYASLELLDNSLFDTVKVDKSLIDKITLNQNGRNFLKNLVNMVVDIDCKVVCEGVETSDQVAFLKGETTCSVVQGFYFDRPLPRDEFEERLKNPDYN